MTTTPTAPGWQEVTVGLVTFAVLLLLFALSLALVPRDDPALLGVVGSTAGGFAGIGAFAAAYLTRIRSLEPFAFRAVAPKWLLVAAMLGIGGYGLNLIIQYTYIQLVGSDDPQGILYAAAKGGTTTFLASLAGGAIFTPFGEEILFRGVVANSLGRLGAWASVGLSSVIFGLAHGISVILPVAVMVGVLAAILLRRTGSVWPCVVLHCVYNGTNSVAAAFDFAPMH